MEDIHEEAVYNVEPQVRIPDTNLPENIVSLKSNTEGNDVEKYGRYLPLALQAIEDRMHIAGPLIIITGYVVIAAFGEMKNLWQYAGYLFILCLGYSVYKIKSKMFDLALILEVTLLLILLALIGWLFLPAIHC